MGNNTVEITSANFKETVEKGGTVILDFWATWCPPCRAFAPVFEAAAKDNPDITFGKIDTDAQQELAGAFQIRSIPTVMVFREKVMLMSQPGSLSRSQLDQLLKQVRELDMAKIHADIAAEQQQKS